MLSNELMKMLDKITCVGPDNQTGYRRHLENLSKLFVHGSYFIINNKDDSEVESLKQLDSDLIIFGGRRWIIRNKHILSSINSKKAVLFCSPIAQAELSEDELNNLAQFIDWLRTGLIDCLFVSSKNLELALNDDSVLHLPAPFFDSINSFENSKDFDIAIFHDLAKHKNFINSVTGSMCSDAKNIQINGVANYAPLLTTLDKDKKIINVGFLDKKNYFEHLRKTKILVHLSFSESFCYTVAEAINNGCLPLVTSAVDWINSSELIVDSPVNIIEIKNKINYLLKLDKKSYFELLNRCKSDLEEVKKIHSKICLDNINSVIKK